MSDLRSLPSVDKLLAQSSSLIETYGRSLTTDAIRSVLDETRSAIRSGASAPDQSGCSIALLIACGSGQ